MPSQTWRERYPEITRVPYHVGIIMDGNGRWAQGRGLPRLAGHKAGTENIRRVLRAATDFGIRVLTIPIEDFAYGFSLILFVLLIRERLKKWHLTQIMLKYGVH